MADPSSSRNTTSPSVRGDGISRLRIWASQYLYPGKSRGGMGNIVDLPFQEGHQIERHKKRGQRDGVRSRQYVGAYPQRMRFADCPPYKKVLEAVEATPTIDKYPEELEAEWDIWLRLSPWTYGG
ncbi:Protein kinase-like domain [Apiospora kogelbergensis]|uniref:Protein kinase-like domain n=1 Tax=Apiospora kogelbergensis TaxID=1337665 RepID=A0AAW0QLF9_9PEZI